MGQGSQPPSQSLRFPRSSRLKSPLAIRRIFKEGSRWRGSGLSAHTTPRTDGDGCRFAIVISRHIGQAHLRNRLRRRVREAIRLNRARWPQNMDVVIRALNDHAAHAAFTDLRADIGQFLGRLQARQA